MHPSTVFFFFGDFEQYKKVANTVEEDISIAGDIEYSYLQLEGKARIHIITATYLFYLAAENPVLPF